MAKKEKIYNPENMGKIKNADGSACITGVCGDTMEITLLIDGDKIKDALFDTDGCNTSRLCGSITISLAVGKRVSDTLKLSPADVIKIWADIPQEGIHCAILAITTLHSALADFLLKRKAFLIVFPVFKYGF